MRRPRFSIRGLMAVVAIAAAVAAALSHPNMGGAIAIDALFLGLLLTAILGALLRRGSRRHFWVGFTLFGWAYLIPALRAFDDPSPFLHFANPTSALVEFLLLAMSGSRKDLLAVKDSLAEIDGESRFIVAFSTVGLLFALAGGLIARGLGREGPATERAGGSGNA